MGWGMMKVRLDGDQAGCYSQVFASLEMGLQRRSMYIQNEHQ